ncbi:hypothetical protein [Paenibacillus rhizoplanae]|uniref:Uncharacterized protein n=1 Tax=Paenibacillus rhizoplanae TaxID=1917181 RepID=A0ABW5F8Q4_9BACL
MTITSAVFNFLMIGLSDSECFLNGFGTEIVKNYRRGSNGGDFGTAGAVATAFVSGFLPRSAVLNQEIWGQQRPKVQNSPQLRSSLLSDLRFCSNELRISGAQRPDHQSLKTWTE